MRTRNLTPMRMSRLHCCQPEVPDPQGCPRPHCVPQEQRQLEADEGGVPTVGAGPGKHGVKLGVPLLFVPGVRLFWVSLSWPEHCDLTLDFGPSLPVSCCPWPKSRSLSCPGTGACGSWPFGVVALGFPLLVAPQLSWRLAKHPAPPAPPSPVSYLPSAWGARGSSHLRAPPRALPAPDPRAALSALGRAPSGSTQRRVAWAPGPDPVPGEGSLAALPGVMLHLGTGIYPLAQLGPINSRRDGCQGPGE